MTKEAQRAKEAQDPERTSRVRTAGWTMLIISLWLILGALALEYGDSGGASHNAVIGIFLSIAAARVLRNPLNSATLSWLIAAGGLIIAAAPFLYQYEAYTLSMANSLWSGLILTLLSVFVIGEALQLKQPLVDSDADDGPTTRAEPQD